MQQVQCSHGKKGLAKISQKLATQESLHWFCKQQNFSVSTLKLPISFYGAMGRGYGSRSAVLVAIGLLLPFLQSPKELTDRHVLLEVDNVTVD